MGDQPLTPFQETGQVVEGTAALLTWPHVAAAALAFALFAEPWRALRPRAHELQRG